MKLRKRILTKMTMGLALVLAAALTTSFIYSLLAARQPVDALPTIRVTYNGTGFPYKHISLSSYSWRFLFIVKGEQVTAPDYWLSEEFEPGPVEPGAPLDISFSYPAREMNISRSKGDSRTFTPVGGDLRTPTEPGVYTYRIEANWGLFGSIQYYVKVKVVDPAAGV